MILNYSVYAKFIDFLNTNNTKINDEHYRQKNIKYIVDFF